MRLYIGFGVDSREVDDNFCKSIRTRLPCIQISAWVLRLNLLPQKRYLLNSIANIRYRTNAGCHYDPSVPKAVIKKHPLLKVSSKVFDLPLFYDKGAIGEQLGYIISFSVASDYHRRIVLPVFENSISTSFPDTKFTGFRGYLYVEADLPGTK